MSSAKKQKKRIEYVDPSFPASSKTYGGKQVVGNIGSSPVGKGTRHFIASAPAKATQRYMRGVVVKK